MHRRTGLLSRGAVPTKAGMRLRPTTRGVGFVLFAVAALILGRRIGAGDFIGLGLGALAMVLVAGAILVARVRRLRNAVHRGHLDVRRELRPARLRSHTSAQVTALIIGSQERPRWAEAVHRSLQTAKWRFEDAVAPLLEPTEPNLQRDYSYLDQRALRYAVTGHCIGRWELGPMSASTVDPFGLLRVRTTVGVPNQVTVWPRTVSLPLAGLIPPLRGRFTASGNVGAPDDVLLRGYVAGDDLRRVHWPTSARRGSLLVRESETSAQRSASVYVDPALLAVDTAPELVNWALEFAASVALSTLAAGHATRLVAVTENRFVGGRGETEQLVLEQLVSTPRLHPDQVPDVRLTTAAHLAGAGHGNALFAVIGPLQRNEIAPIQALVAPGQPAYAWVLLPARATTGQQHDADQTAAALRRAGWLVNTCTADAELAQVWTQHLGAALHDVGAVAHHDATDLVGAHK